MTEKASSL